MNRTPAAPLMEEYRGSLVENVHCGHICVLDEEDRIVYSVGDPHHIAYLRSSAKPIQALAFMAMGLDEAFGLDDRERTLIAGSHQGGEYHVRAIEGLAEKLGIDESALVLLPAYPANAGYREEAIRVGRQPRKFYHNCSGKHLATIAMARALGQAEDTYYQPGTPVQAYLLAFMAKMTGHPQDQIVVGVDGCGVPVYGLPLQAMARAYLRMGCPDLLEGVDPSLPDKARRLDAAMHAYPRYINKEDYICTCMNEDPNLFAKGGAQGIYCFAIKDRRLAVSFKVADGSEEEWQLLVWEILHQLGYRDTIAMRNMLRLRPMDFLDATGRVAGRYQPVFALDSGERP